MAVCPNVDDELSRYLIDELEGLEEGIRQGSGSFGSVYRVRWNGMPCIAKRLHDILDHRQAGAGPGTTARSNIRDRFRNECILLSRIRHPNIVQFLGVHYGAKEGDLTLVLEHLHMDLEQCLATYPNMPLSIKLGVLKDVSYGLLHLHTRKPAIVHRDLTASNVLVTPDMRAKIADLGVSRLLDVTPADLSNVTACPGTLPYMPPEALRPKPEYDVRLDSFSFGVLSLCTATQETPRVYYGISVPEKIQREGTSELFKRQNSMDKLPQGHCLYPLVNQCLSDNPEKRPSAAEINKTMKKCCADLPKRFPSVLEMHSEIWKLHGERQQMAMTLQSQVPQTTVDEERVAQYTNQIQSLTIDRDELQQRNIELERRLMELQLVVQQQPQLDPELTPQLSDLRPLVHHPVDINTQSPGHLPVSPPKDHPYANLPMPLVPVTTTSSSTSDDLLTPINAPHHIPPPSNLRQFGLHTPYPTEPVVSDFHDFSANGQFSGPPSVYSSASTTSQFGSSSGSVPALDPNLKCHGCGQQFREGEIQVFKKHTDACEKIRRHPSPAVMDDVIGYHHEEVVDTGEQELDPNLTCIGCGMGFKERQIQDYSRHCGSCSEYKEALRQRAQRKETETQTSNND